MSYFIGF